MNKHNTLFYSLWHRKVDKPLTISGYLPICKLQSDIEKKEGIWEIGNPGWKAGGMISFFTLIRIMAEEADELPGNNGRFVRFPLWNLPENYELRIYPSVFFSLLKSQKERGRFPGSSKLFPLLMELPEHAS